MHNFLYVRRILTACVLASIAAPDASAVSVSADGQGQVLIFPYYTVNNGLNTLLSISNTRRQPKALRVRFLEHRNGQEVAAFNLYLGPFDVWTGAIVADGPEGDSALTSSGARLYSNDPSCTVPALGNQGLGFGDEQYAVTHRDEGPYEISRTREGFVEVIEMGALVDVDSAGFLPAQAVRAGSSGLPRNCPLLEAAWSLPAGRWQGDPQNTSLGIASPNGGLQGSSIFVSPAFGTAFSVAPTVLDGFFNASPGCAPECASTPGENLHAPPDSPTPSLASARDADGEASALIVQKGQSYRLRFTGENAGLKATSAVLMQQSVANEYFTARHRDGRVYAASDWVVTFPTRRLHLAQSAASERLPFVQPYVAGNADQSPPYRDLLASQRGCEASNVQVTPRDGRATTFPDRSGFQFPTPPPLPSGRWINRTLCSSVRAYAFGEDASWLAREWRPGLGSTAPSPVLGAYSYQPVPDLGAIPSDSNVRTGAGWMQLQLGDSRFNFMYAGSTPDAAQPNAPNVLTGLPAIGFWASSYQAGDAQGTLANYALFAAHSGERIVHRGVVAVAADGSVSWQPAQP